MKIHLIIIALICSWLTGIITVNAQQTEFINGREFIVHKVQKNETLYGISKKYDVPLDTITAYNPGSNSVIKIDQVLKFPRYPMKPVVKEPQVDNEPAGKALHKVEQGETLYGIAQKYGCEVKDILVLNPQIRDGGNTIKPGDPVFVPVKNTKPVQPELVKEQKEDRLDIKKPNNNGPLIVSGRCDSVGFSDKSIDIALLLPFAGGLNAGIAAEFYAGAKLAADSLSVRVGKDIHLYVYDTRSKSDSDQVTEILQRPEIRDMELVIGPLYASNIKQALPLLSDMTLPLVSPFSRNESLVENNPYIIKVTPSEKVVARKTVEYFVKRYPDGNFILANPAYKKDSLNHLYYVEALQAYAGKDTNNYHFLSSRAGVSGRIKPGKVNIIFYPCSKELTVINFMTQFNKSVKKNDVILVGTEEWLDFTNVEADYYENLSLHIPVVNYESFQDSLNHNIIKGYQAQFGVDPTKFSIKAYHIMEYFVNAILFAGSEFYLCPEISVTADIPVKYRFVRPSSQDGWENQSLRMMIFSGYSYRFSHF